MNLEIVEKVQDANAALEEMRAATDARRFKRAFTSCLACVRSIEYKLDGMTTRSLRKSGRKGEIPEFKNWWADRLAEARNDDLLSWAQSARDSDTHIADGNGVQFAYSNHVDYLNTDDLEPGPPGSRLSIMSDGTFWILNEGTASERRIPVVARPGTASAGARNVTRIWVENAPTSHLGQPVTTVHPIELCEFAVRHWEQLAQETFDKWWGPQSAD